MTAGSHSPNENGNATIDSAEVGCHKSNRDGIGAEVTVGDGSGPEYATVSTAAAIFPPATSVSFRAWGKKTLRKRIEIRWPSGIRQTLKDMPADQILQIDSLPPHPHHRNHDYRRTNAGFFPVLGDGLLFLRTPDWAQSSTTLIVVWLNFVRETIPPAAGLFAGVEATSPGATGSPSLSGESASAPSGLCWS